MEPAITFDDFDADLLDSCLPPKGIMGSSNMHLLSKTRWHFTAYVSPAFCNNVKGGVRALLNDVLLSYSDDHEAIMLAYSDLQLHTDRAVLLPWVPLLTIKASADIVLFSPRPGDVLCGYVHKINSQMITLAVMGCIGVVIPAAFMPAGWSYDFDYRCWVPDGDYTRAVLAGDLMTCVALDYPTVDRDDEELLFHMTGTLLSDHAGLSNTQTALQEKRRKDVAVAKGQYVYDLDELEELEREELEQQRKRECKQSKTGQPQTQQEQQAAGHQQPLQAQPVAAADGRDRESKEERKQKKEQRKAEKAAAKAAKKEQRKAEKAAEKAARKADRKREKELEKAQRKAEKAAAKAASKRKQPEQASPSSQPPAKKHKPADHANEQPQQQHMQQQQPPQQQQMNGTLAAAQQPSKGGSSLKADDKKRRHSKGHRPDKGSN